MVHAGENLLRGMKISLRDLSSTLGAAKNSKIRVVRHQSQLNSPETGLLRETKPYCLWLAHLQRRARFLFAVLADF